MVPTTRPKLTQEALLERIAPFIIDRGKYPLIVVCYRGYYLNSMGKTGVNDRGIYDDAIFIDSPNVFAAFNGNVDPSKYRKGYGTAESTKGMASLAPGVHYAHTFDYHKGKYLALCQRAGPVTVVRDGNPPYKDTGYFGINLHKGSYNSTSSEGCPTVYPTQWLACISLLESEAKRLFGKRWRSAIVPIVVIEENKI
jgi:hypothetical protein